MKKHASILLVFLLLVGMSCQENALVTSPRISSAVMGGNALPKATLTNCTQSGGPTYPETGSYNCHQYVKGALVMKKVNLTTGQPQAINFSLYYDAGTIQLSDDFIRVCSRSDAQAIAHLPIGADHSTLITGSSYSYSYPGATSIYASGSPLNYGTACDYEYYAAIADVTIQGPAISGSNYTFTLANRSNYGFIINDAARWSYDHNSFSEVSRTGDQLVISPRTAVSGNFTVSATINTTATQNPAGACAMGVNGTVSATVHTPTRTNSFTVTPPPPDCGGKLDNGTLYTVNSVTKGVQHTVVMNAPSWTWVKTSGNASWYGYGNTLTFTISSGSATFNAYGSGCNLTMTFYAY